MRKSAWLAIAASLCLSGGGFGYELYELGHNREHSVRESCEGSDSRNANTKAKLKQELVKAGVPAAQRAPTEKFTEALINTLAPYKNCDDALTKAGF